MLCNIYMKEAQPDLRRLGIDAASPVFFLDLPTNLITTLKGKFVKDVFEIYLVQEDPYLKNLSRTWVNGGVVLPEIIIKEKIVETPARIIEKFIEVPQEIIKEVPVIKEVIKEVVREVKVPGPTIITESMTKSRDIIDEEGGILIDTKASFEEWRDKTLKPAPLITEDVRPVEVKVEEVKEEIPVKPEEPVIQYAQEVEEIQTIPTMGAYRDPMLDQNVNSYNTKKLVGVVDSGELDLGVPEVVKDPFAKEDFIKPDPIVIIEEKEEPVKKTKAKNKQGEFVEVPLTPEEIEEFQNIDTEVL